MCIRHQHKMPCKIKQCAATLAVYKTTTCNKTKLNGNFTQEDKHLLQTQDYTVYKDTRSV